MSPFIVVPEQSTRRNQHPNCNFVDFFVDFVLVGDSGGSADSASDIAGPVKIAHCLGMMSLYGISQTRYEPFQFQAKQVVVGAPIELLPQ